MGEKKTTPPALSPDRSGRIAIFRQHDEPEFVLTQTMTPTGYHIRATTTWRLMQVKEDGK